MEDYYTQAQKILLGLAKQAQQNDPELASPEIKIEPMEGIIDKAVKLLKSINPSYFIGVRKIVVDTGSSGYGHVASGQGNDPAVIHINLPRIKNELQGKLSGASPEQFEKELVRQVASVISHEKGHISSYKAETGFSGGESPAENEEHQMGQRISQRQDQ